MDYTDGYCVAQAILNASAYLRRPLNVDKIRYLLNTIAKHKCFPNELLNTLPEYIKELSPFVMIFDKSRFVIEPESLPGIAFYGVRRMGKNKIMGHAEFFPEIGKAFKDIEKIYAVIIFYHENS